LWHAFNVNTRKYKAPIELLIPSLQNMDLCLQLVASDEVSRTLQQLTQALPLAHLAGVNPTSFRGARAVGISRFPFPLHFPSFGFVFITTGPAPAAYLSAEGTAHVHSCDSFHL
jgi:hypothetical protein